MTIVGTVSALGFGVFGLIAIRAYDAVTRGLLDYRWHPGAISKHFCFSWLRYSAGIGSLW